MSILATKDVAVHYGPVRAIDGLTITVDKGEIACLVGSNGAGKSSSLKGIMGLEAASGEVTLDAVRLDTLATAERVRRGIALVPEGRHIFPQMTVRDNLLAGCRGESRSVAAARMEEITAIFPRLLERIEQLAGTMSGGEQQMLAIGRALMSAPRVLLLDEPTLGLAPSMVDRVAETLIGLRDKGLAILLAEQNLHMALGIADRGYVLESGRVTISASSAELRGNPRVREAYLGAE
ncbi:ABC transporter ATP-binding protein [Bosea sp. (in: a-proteobacteria)]|uniref:ABC transporter ATP-binding protein n=1 Tax=Bosea sp. (in: a-proteobacteria) TaxID=1871050 RepID=UPI0026087182|nr:ABC transporter ATP-binding protein [Bosea sp. (in: a-proteobacteria)]MCO5090907.1 ABC transporter ATP-binding protein [Bosea sp. (in: a-proteobacteria)]